MKKLLALGAIAASLSFSANAAVLRGNVSWNNGHWTCEAYNSKGRDIYVKRVFFKGDKRRRGEATFTRSIKTWLKDGQGIRKTQNNVGQVDYVRSCGFWYK